MSVYAGDKERRIKGGLVAAGLRYSSPNDRCAGKGGFMRHYSILRHTSGPLVN